MSRFVVVLAPAAEADVGEALRWYRERNAMVADAFREAVFDAIDQIADQPLKHPVVDIDGNRKRILRRFPYSVWYEFAGETVTVLAVAHHRRLPGPWKR